MLTKAKGPNTLQVILKGASPRMKVLKVAEGDNQITLCSAEAGGKCCSMGTSRRVVLKST